MDTHVSGSRSQAHTHTHTHTHTVHSVCRASGFQEDTWMILASGLLFSSHNLRGSVAARII